MNSDQPPKLPSPDEDGTKSGPITEIEENLFRNLLARIREEKPGVFRDICMDAMTHRMPQNTMILNRRRNGDGTVDGMILVTSGVEITYKTVESLDSSMVDFLREIDGDLFNGA